MLIQKAVWKFHFKHCCLAKIGIFKHNMHAVRNYEINLLIIINPIKRFKIVHIFLPLNQKQKIALQRDTDIVQVQSD
jgi:hypothetical protein